MPSSTKRYETKQIWAALKRVKMARDILGLWKQTRSERLLTEQYKEQFIDVFVAMIKEKFRLFCLVRPEL